MPTTNRLWVKCKPCGHLPMEMGKAAAAMKRIYCPSCTETKRIFVADAADIPKEERHADAPSAT